MTQHPASANARPASIAHPSQGLGGNMIAIASGKGGVGKTWFSITLAHSLSRSGRKVLLFDGDLGLANVDIQLGLMPKGDLWQVLNGGASFNDVVSHDRATGVDIVTGRSGVAGLADASGEDLDRLCRGLSLVGEMYDDVIIDLGAGVDKSVRTLAASAGRVMVLTNVEPTSITDAYALIKLLHQSTSRRDISIVVNGAEDQRDGERTYSKLKMACETFLRISPPLAGMIHQDKHVPDAIRRQMPLITRSPVSRAVTDVERIARGLAGIPSI
jgi:flagellar biosynthesis protein FlhG